MGRVRQLAPRCVVAAAIFLLWSGAAQALSFTSVTPGPSPTPTYEPYEIDAQLDTAFDNPYDPDQIQVGAVVTLPSGAKREVNLFWFEPYARSLVQGAETFTPNGPGRWRFRFAPPAVGSYAVRLTAEAHGQQTATSDEITFAAAAGSSHGFVRVNADNPRYFVFDDGVGYVPLGFDVCWTDDNSGDYSLMSYFDSLVAGGGNWTRLWMTAFAQSTVLEWGADHPTGYFQGLGRYSQQIGAKLDALFAYAAQQGLYIELVLHQHSQFQCAQWSSWSDNPYNAANGGPCQTSADYFTGGAALTLAAKLHRYLVARYAAYRSIMAWELFNEVDGIEGVSASVTDQWQRAAAASLHAMDPAGHLVATSYMSPVVFPYFDLTGFDFNNRHQYDFGEELIDFQAAQYHNANRPVLLAEFGIDPEGYFNKNDPLGLNIHNAIWLAVMSGYAGGAMSWWWDNYIDPNSFWNMNAGPTAFLHDEDLAAFDENKVFATSQSPWRRFAGGLVHRDTDRLRALGWAWDRASDWFAGSAEPPPVSGLAVTVADDWDWRGPCRAEFWNVWTGEKTGQAKWTAAGAVTVALPDFTRDLAFKLECAAAPDDDASPDDDVSPDDDDDNDAADDDDDNDAVDDDQSGGGGSSKTHGCGC